MDPVGLHPPNIRIKKKLETHSLQTTSGPRENVEWSVSISRLKVLHLWASKDVFYMAKYIRIILKVMEM
jgi:hypothetical protein